MIRVQDVHKVYDTRFGETEVLNGVNFDLAMGERLGVLGRNGAGKSTLIRLISGAERPSSGRITSDISISWPLAFGGAFQPTLTGIDNVRFISRIYNQDFDKNIAFVENFAELGPYLREEVRTYSSGMRARLAFAISMIIEFDCFLIDEVGAVGDARFHERCNRELFQNRGDRAMVIISHDASYIRDHCNRYAVLDKGKLDLFDDFELAYSDFRQKIGLHSASNPAKDEDAIPLDRAELVESTHLVAVRDEGFRVIVQDADWRRDDKEWAKAESIYAQALALFPYQRSYWVQRGHCAKESGNLIGAEAAYRTACALGEPVADIRQHLTFVMNKLGASATDYPIRSYSSATARNQAPGWPDIEVFARAAWLEQELKAEEILSLLRHHATCDSLMSAMIEDPRFRHAQHAWIHAARQNQTEKAELPEKLVGKLADAPQWARNLATIACPATGGGEPAKIARQISLVQNAWPVLMQADAFPGWSATHAAIRAVTAKG